MTIYLVCMLILNCLIGFILFRKFYIKRKVFNDRFGMIMSVSSSGILSLSISMHLQFLFSIHMHMITFLTVIVCGCIGTLFGSLVKFQSLLAGFFQGVIGSLMGNMLSAVIKDPTLCSLPATYLNSVEQNMFAFSLFGILLVFITTCLVNYSLRV